MDRRTFYTQFTIINVLSFIGITASLYIPSMAEHYALAWAYFLFFSIFVWLTYILAVKAAASENKNDFTRLTITLIFFKMLFCIMISVIYDKGLEPSNNHHVLYFLILYVIYSVFEFRILHKMSYQK